MAAVVRVLVIDDHELVRQTLVERLRREEDIALVGGVGSLADALAALRAHRPDVALIDMRLGAADGLEVVRAAKMEGLPTRFVVVSGFVYDRYIDTALELGVAGYVSKSEPALLLVSAIRMAAAGASYFSPAVQQRLLPLRSPEGGRCWQSRGGTLTQRQRDVLAHIARGLTKGEVARLLGVSPKTVETHCEMMMRRLAVSDRVELTRFAIREGLVEA